MVVAGAAADDAPPDNLGVHPRTRGLSLVAATVAMVLRREAVRVPTVGEVSCHLSKCSVSWQERLSTAESTSSVKGRYLSSRVVW